MTAEKAPVYRDMSTSSEVLTTLPSGTAVTVHFAVRSVLGSWCRIALQDDRQSYGFVLCSQIHRDQPNAATGITEEKSSTNPECKALVDELMQASGTDSEFALISRDFITAMSVNGTKGLGEQDQSEIIAILQRELDGVVLGAEVHRGLVHRCNPANYTAALDVFRSPLVAQMVKLETGPKGPSGMPGGRDGASAERMALIRRLDRAQGTAQFLIGVITDMGVVMASTMSGQAPRQGEVDSMRSQLDQRLRPMLLSAYAGVYRSVSDEDLRKYAVLWESQPLRQFNSVYQSVFREVMKTQSQVVATEMKAYLESRRPRGATR